MALRRKKRKQADDDVDPLGGFSLDELLGLDLISEDPQKEQGVVGKIVTLPFTPGTLLIFGGQKTLHRVTRVHGPRPRLVPVLCYSEAPGMQNSPAVRKLFWGRANPGDALQPPSH